MLSHCNHLSNVEYDCTGWLQQARDTSAARFAKTIVQESTRYVLNLLGVLKWCEVCVCACVHVFHKKRAVRDDVLL